MKSATIDEATIRLIEKVEMETGTTLVAYAPANPYADLDDAQLQRIRDLEQDIGLIVVAYPGKQD